MRFLPAIATALVLLMAAAPRLGADQLPAGLFLVYPPRTILAGLAFCLTVWTFLRRKTLLVLCSCLSLALATIDMGFGGDGTVESSAPAGRHIYGLLSANILEDEAGVDEVVNLIRSSGVQFVLLQEIRKSNHRHYEERLPDFALYAPPREGEKQHPEDVIDSMVFLVHRSIAASDPAPKAHWGITGYRSCALEVPLEGKTVLLVNIHFTKGIWTGRGLIEGIRNLTPKATRHRDEVERWRAFAQSHVSGPMLAAGDFNAPWSSRAVQVPGFEHAHDVAGEGLHLTWPASFPLIGIDQVMGSASICFHRYSTTRLRCSDHLAQIARFSLR